MRHITNDSARPCELVHVEHIWTNSSRGLDGWLNIEFRYEAFCSRLPSRYAFYLSPGGSSPASFFHVSVRRNSLPSGYKKKALEV